MRTIFLVLPALLLAGGALAQDRPNPLDPRAKVPEVEFRSAFEGYRSFTAQDLADWRRANEEVGSAGGHAGHRPGQGPGQQTSKPQPGKPESPGGSAESSQAAPADKGHGGHK